MIDEGRTPDLSIIHRLVQEVIRIKLKNEKKEEGVLRNAFDVLDKRYDTHSSGQCNIDNKDYKTVSAVLVCVHASNYDSLHKRILQLFESLISEEKKRTLVVKETKEIIKDGELFLRHAVQKNDVKLVNLILSSVQNKWDNNDIQNLLIGFVNDDDAQKSKIIKFLISRIEDVNIIDVIHESHRMKVIKALIECGKLNRERKFAYLVEAIEDANLDVVKFILEDESNLVNEKLKKKCFAYDDDNEYAYFVKEGSNISKLACKVSDWLYKGEEGKLDRKSKSFVKELRKNIEEIIALIKEAKEKIRDVPSILNNSTFIKSLDSGLGGEMVDSESDTESLLSIGDASADEESDFELLGIPPPSYKLSEVSAHSRNRSTFNK